MPYVPKLKASGVKEKKYKNGKIFKDKNSPKKYRY